MTRRTTTVRNIGFAIAFALSTLSFSTAGHAYTAEEQRLCTADAFKFCASDIPNIDAITACMKANKAKLSVGCRSVMK